jgi:hypothetical protein
VALGKSYVLGSDAQISWNAHGMDRPFSARRLTIIAGTARPGTPCRSREAPPGGYIEVWIDAETGEFLGGTFQ